MQRRHSVFLDSTVQGLQGINLFQHKFNYYDNLFFSYLPVYVTSDVGISAADTQLEGGGEGLGL